MSDLFWPLDTYYHEVPTGTEMHLWGKDGSGATEHLIDDSLLPHFLSSLNLFESDQPPELRGVYDVYKKVNGVKQRLWKFHFLHPRNVRDYRPSTDMVSVGGDYRVDEADVMFTEVYSNYKRLTVSGWNIPPAEGELPSLWKPWSQDPPVLTILPLDIECYNKPKAGSVAQARANPQVDPINVVGTGFWDGYRESFQSLRMDDYPGPDEKEMLYDLAAEIKRRDPDIITTYGGTRFDLKYLMDRCNLLGVEFGIGRDGTRPHEGQYGAWRINGRAHVDLNNWAKQVIPHIKPLSLKNVGKQYLRLPEDQVMDLGRGRQWWYWENDRETFIRYNLSDVAVTMKLIREVLPFSISLSSLTGLPLGQLYENKGHRTAPHQIDHYLMKTAIEEDEVIPLKPHEKKDHSGFKGAVVVEPAPGIDRDVWIVDFKSMYPHIIMKLFPDTFMARSIRRLFDERKKHPVIKTMLGQPTGPNYAMKILLTVCWGYYGWDGARWGDLEKAMRITQTEREIISACIDMTRESGFNVRYGDTDSVFFKEQDNDITPEDLRKMIEDRFRMPVELELPYRRIFFARTKKGERGRMKAYFALDHDGKPVVKGFETIKDNWCGVAKAAQRSLGGIVLYTEDPIQGLNFSHHVVKKMYAGKFSLEDYVIRTNSKQTPDENGEYRTMTPQLAIRERLGLGEDALIEWVVVKGSGDLWEKAKAVEEGVTIDEIDIDYYARRQVIPAAMRVLEVFGISEDEVLNGVSTARLDA